VATRSDLVTLVDTNVLVDVLTQDDEWVDWSSSMLEEAADAGLLAINPIIYAEVSVAYSRIEDLDAVLPTDYYLRTALPWQAGFLAGKAFVRYKRRGGARCSPLPDFYIGAHAAVSGMRLLTRDAARYRAYFPKLRVISP
jgi:predicted nucleic acid-binding protein